MFLNVCGRVCFYMYVWVHGGACLHVWKPDVKGKIDNSIIVVGKFNILFSIMDRITYKEQKGRP